MATTLIQSPAAREARVELKRNTLLRFLGSNVYTSAAIAGEVMGIASRQGVHSTLVAMERDSLLRREQVEAHGRKWTLWGITAHGQAYAFDPEIGEKPESKYFEPSRVGHTVLAHTLDLQRLRLQVERAGWKGWQLGDQLGKWQSGISRPDALVTSPSGTCVALECERTLKTVKRYEAILADRLQSIKRGVFVRCVWICPTLALATRLRSIIASIDAVAVAGARVPILDRHRATLGFGCYDNLLQALGD